MVNDPIRLRICRCGSAARLQGGSDVFYFQCRNPECGMLTPFCSSIADAAARWNRCMGPEVGEPVEIVTGPPVCEWWECHMAEVAQKQKEWCAENGWSCGLCPYNTK